MPAPAPLRGWVKRMTEWELRQRGSCDNCHHSGEEDWPQKKTALLCLHPGKYRGRVTQIFPTGHRGVIYGCAAPAWCEGFAPRE